MNITSCVLAANLGPIIVFKMALKHLECERATNASVHLYRWIHLTDSHQLEQITEAR